jgi:hypothetical protein
MQFVVLLMYVVGDVFGSHAGWRIGALAAAGPLHLRSIPEHRSLRGSPRLPLFVTQRLSLSIRIKAWRVARFLCTMHTQR